MTRGEADTIIRQINSVAGWRAWPAKGSTAGVPLVWFTRVDGSTRIHHATRITDWYAVLNAREKKGSADVHRD